MRITDVRIGDTPRVHDNVDGTKMYEFRVFYKADGKPKDARKSVIIKLDKEKYNYGGMLCIVQSADIY